MRAVVLGGTGHVGTFLVPRLVEAGYDVTVVSRGNRQPYRRNAAWGAVRRVAIDRAAAEQAGTFTQQVLDLEPDVLVDAICYRLESAVQLVEALRGKVQHYLFVGSIWVHGHSVAVPTPEDQPRHPFGDYGKQKAAIEDYLLDQTRRYGFPATVLHPGHIVGPGWMPINPAGNLNPQVFERLARGEELALPHLGLETLHHVHADDVAQACLCALSHWSAAVGQSFHVVSPAALTLRGYAEQVAGWFGQTARLQLLPWEEWRQGVSEQDAALTWDHIAHSPNCSIAKAQRLIGYQPRYTSLQAIYEAVDVMIAQGGINAPRLGA